MNYNDYNVFRSENQQDLVKKLDGGFVKIPIYYGFDDDDKIMMDMESMMDEFQRTVSGIGTVIDEVQGTDFH